MKSKRTYKIIACVSIWLSVIIAIFCFAIAKTKAGVIIEESYIKDTTNVNVGSTWTTISLDKVQYMGIKNTSLSENEIAYILDGNTTAYTLTLRKYDGETAGYARYSIAFSRPASYPNITQTYFAFDLVYINNIQYLMFDFKSPVNLNNLINIQGAVMRVFSSQIDFFTKGATISAVDNIYDLKQNDVALIYFSDISGLDTTAYRDEITINWGYIDNNDNTQFTVHAPTIGAKRTDNNIISLEMPINAAGDATSYYTIDQSAILSTISAGGATATAHIYGIYVWIQQSRIQWGLAEFDTSGLPASGASMNYITSLTSLYDYTAVNTSTMTCRLSVSDNFNFITIKNQPILSAYNINTVIQQGGFLPAWAVYNWARGSSAGYTSGEQAGAAPYQPGAAGYQEIYEAGRQAGIAENIGTVNWFVSAFQAVDAMLNIRIFPNITIGYLVGIPFVISVVWFIIRMFRGGGSSS